MLCVSFPLAEDGRFFAGCVAENSAGYNAG